MSEADSAFFGLKALFGLMLVATVIACTGIIIGCNQETAQINRCEESGGQWINSRCYTGLKEIK